MVSKKSYHLSRILRVPEDFFTSVVDGAPVGGNPSEAGSADGAAGVERGSSWNLRRKHSEEEQLKPSERIFQNR